MISSGINRKAARIAGVDMREIGNSLIDIGTGHIFDIADDGRAGRCSRELFIEAVGERYELGLNCMKRRWFWLAFSESDPDNPPLPDFGTRTEACIALTHLLEVMA